MSERAFTCSTAYSSRSMNSACEKEGPASLSQLLYATNWDGRLGSTSNGMKVVFERAKEDGGWHLSQKTNT